MGFPIEIIEYVKFHCRDNWNRPGPDSEVALRTRPAALIMIAAVAVSPLLFGCVEDWARESFNAVIYFSSIWWLLADRGKNGNEVPLDYCPAAWAAGGICVVGMLQSVNPTPISYPSPLLPFSAAPSLLPQALRMVGAQLALLVCMPDMLRSRGARLGFLFLLSVTGMTTTLFGLASCPLYGLRAVPNNFSAVRVFAQYYNANHGGAFLNLCLPPLFFAWTARFFSHRGRTSLLQSERLDFWIQQSLWGVLLLVIAAGVVRTNSKGAMVAGGGAVLAGGLVSHRTGKRRGRTVPILMPLAFLVAMFVLHRLLSPLSPQKASAVTDAADRITNIYRPSAALSLLHPLFGTGLGSFSSVFPYVHPRTLFGFLPFAHDDLLQLACECGWPMALLCFTAIGLQMAARSNRTAPNIEQLTVWERAGAFGACMGFILHSFVDFNFQIPSNAAVFFAWLSHLAPAKDAADTPPLRNNAPVVSLFRRILPIFFLAELIGSLRALAVSYNVLEARSAPREQVPYYLQRALVLSPGDVKLNCMQGLAYISAGEPFPGARQPLYRLALGNIDGAVRQSPLEPSCLHERSYVLWALGRRRDSEEDWGDLRRIAPWVEKTQARP